MLASEVHPYEIKLKYPIIPFNDRVKYLIMSDDPASFFQIMQPIGFIILLIGSLLWSLNNYDYQKNANRCRSPGRNTGCCNGWKNT